jgi:hypothetical protein
VRKKKKDAGVMTELSDILTNPRRWKLHNNERTKPHEVAVTDAAAGKIAVLVVRRNRTTGDWAVGEGPLKYLAQGLQDGRLVEAHVAFVVKGTTVFAHANLTAVLANIGPTEAFDGTWGSYFWLDDAFRPVMNNRRNAVSDDEPF